MTLETFHPKLFGIGAKDIKSFLSYLHEKVYLGKEPLDVSINRYKDIYLFANIFMKRKLNLFLHEMNEGRDIADVLRRELFITAMEHHLLHTAQSFAFGLHIIVKPDKENIDLSVPTLKGFLYFFMLPSTFLPMSGEMGKKVGEMIQGLGAIRASDETVSVAIPFFLKDPFAAIAGWGTLSLMLIVPVGLVAWHAVHLPSYLKFNRLKEIEYGLSLFTPLMQMTQNGYTMHEGFEYMKTQMKHPALVQMLREVSAHYDHGNSNMANIFQRYGFGREITDVIDEIEKSGVEPVKALTRGVDSLEMRRVNIRADYAVLLSEVPRWFTIGVLAIIIAIGLLSYFDAFLGTSITH